MRVFYTFLFILYSTVLFSQTETTTTSDSVKVVAIDFNEIANEAEQLNLRFSDINKTLQDHEKLTDVDSSLLEIHSYLNSQENKSSLDTINVSYRKIETNRRKWEELKNEVEGYKSIIDDRSDNLQDISDELFAYIDVWTLTLKDAKEKEVSDDIISSVDTVIATIQSTITLNTQSVDSVFRVQKEITYIILVIDDAISELDLREHKLKRGYFVIDSPPIWTANDTDHSRRKKIQRDSLTLSVSSYYYELVYQGTKTDRVELKEYLKNNITSLIFQIATFIFLFVLLFILRRKILKGKGDNLDPVKYQYRVILENPILSVFSLGSLITVFYYPNRPLSLGEITSVILIICAIFLLPKLIGSSLKPLLIATFAALSIYLLLNYLPQEDFIYRMAIYINLLLLIFIIHGLKSNTAIRDLIKEKWRNLFSIFLFWYFLLIITALIANTIGSVNLAVAIGTGVTTSVLLAFIIILFINILIDISLMLLENENTSSIDTINVLVDMINVRVAPMLKFFGFILWIGFTLKGFNVFHDFMNALSSLFDLKWNIGSLTISVGGILSFLLILFITFLLTKIVSNIFKDDWVVKSMPKGSSSGASMVLRIVIVSVGLYLALTSAGIDVGKLGFIVGALGVGIGFGLQNIVLNFIAGLILAFEKPISIGDLIEADMERGIVTEIGVRASKITLYDGSEAIIPNGDLIAKKVLNYTLSNNKRRSKIIVKTSVYADPNEVIELLSGIGIDHEKTLMEPHPITYFKGYGDSSLDFHLLYWTNIKDTFRVESDIAIKAYNLLKEKDIHLPIPRVSIDKGNEDI